MLSTLEDIVPRTMISLVSYPVIFHHDNSMLILNYGPYFIKLNYENDLDNYNFVLDDESNCYRHINVYSTTPSPKKESIFDMFDKNLIYGQIDGSILSKEWGILNYESGYHNNQVVNAVYLIKNINSTKTIILNLNNTKGINYNIIKKKIS